MPAFCLIQSQANKFIKGLREGEIDPGKLSELSSGERHDYLAKFVGEENAQGVNSLFESKLLLKNQQAGMISWAKKVGGMTIEAKRDLISRIERMETVLNPTEETGFLKDLASTRLGTEITPEEAKTVFDLSQKVQEAKTSMNKDFTFNSEKERLAYGKTRVDLSNYVNELKGNDKLTLKSLADIGGISKSIRASFDDSAIFRQGWKTMLTNPSTWAKNAIKTFSDIARTVKGSEVMNEVMADRESRLNELNGNYKKMGLAVSKAEEAFPTSIPEKIPVLGRLYKASENAYTGFIYKIRMDLADKYIQIADKTGVELTPKELKSIGSMVNSLTGRGDFGKYEGSAVNATNNVLFSPRYLKSQFDTLGHTITGAGGSNFVRKQAAFNLVKVVGGIATIMTISNALQPGSAETDPRSADFGKIKVGDTRFDITGGMSSLVTLASRIATQSSKSSTTGNITPINSDQFGAKTGHDVVDDFMTNKFSPIAQVVNDLLNQKDRNGNPLTVGGELSNLGVPLSVSTFNELRNDPNSAPIVIAMIADALGIATNTYSPISQKIPNWSSSTSKTLTTFKNKVGDAKFKEANQKYNKELKDWQTNIIKTDAYKSLPQSEKDTVLQKGKDAIQKRVLKSYNFTFKATRQTQQQQATIKKLTPK